MKILIIYNPLAGKKNKKDKLIKNFLAKKEEIEIKWHYTTEGPFTNLNPNDFDRIFAAGGDGTIREVASWILDNKSFTPLAILPIGSANILAISLGIPMEIKKALQLGFTAKTEKIDVGVVNNRHYFLIAAGCGFDAHVIKKTPRKAKQTWGSIAYIASLVINFFNSKAKKFFIKIDGQQKTATAQSVFISNFASFLNLTINPKAKINDGFLNVSILKTLNIKDVGVLFYRLLKGTYKRDYRYEYYNAKAVYVLPFYRKTPMQIDGEIVDLPYMDIKILPQILNIIANKLP